MLGKEKRRAKQRAERDAHNQKYFEIGLSSTPREFETAYDESFTYYLGNLLYDPHEHLRKGAIQAFMEGRPENVQFMLSNHDKLNLIAANILLELVKGDDNGKIVALINRTLEDLSKRDKQALLDKALIRAIVLHTHDIVKRLLDHGAEYKGALLLMETEGWNQIYPDCKEKLHAYWGHDALSLTEQLQENLRDITVRLEKAEQRITELESGKKTSAPAPRALPKVLRRGTSSQP